MVSRAAEGKTACPSSLAEIRFFRRRYEKSRNLSDRADLSGHEISQMVNDDCQTPLARTAIPAATRCASLQFLA
jgi:hypothetical protein